MTHSLVTVIPFVPNTELETVRITQWTNDLPGLVATQIDFGQKSPVQVIGDEISINERLISKGDWHEYAFKGKKYVLHMPDEGVIEIYEVKK